MEQIDNIQREKKIVRVTLVGSVCNLVLLVLKFMAGILGQSAAMIADAVHSLSDFVTDIIVIVFVRISSKPSDEDHDFGHGKFETLATLAIATLLFAVGIMLFWKGLMAIVCVLDGESIPAPSLVAFVAAVVSIVVKEGLYWYTKLSGRKLQSRSMEANAWHHRSDALSSIGTALGIGGAILLGGNWCILDPIAAMVVSLLIVRVAWQLFKPCVEELLERSLPEEEEADIMHIVAEYPEVVDPHNLRTRRIGNYAAVDLHVRMDPEMTVRESHTIVTAIEHRIKALFGPDSIVNIHVEPKK